MFSEIVNTLFLTYLTTEYLSASDTASIWGTTRPAKHPSIDKNDGIDCDVDTLFQRFRKTCAMPKQQRVLAITFLVISINGFDHVTGLGQIARSFLEQFFHIPKVLFAATTYMTTLYYDCRFTVQRSSGVPVTNCSNLHHQSSLPWYMFVSRVAKAFVQILPVYPILAVLISFGFLFVINMFEFLHLPTDLLNMPIYYGTLYGPFSYIYMTVKRSVREEYRSLLPQTHLQRLTAV